DPRRRRQVRQAVVFLFLLATVGVLRPPHPPALSDVARAHMSVAGWLVLWAGVAVRTIPALAGVLAALGFVLWSNQHDRRGRRWLSLTSLAVVLWILAVASCVATACRASPRGECAAELGDSPD